MNQEALTALFFFLLSTAILIFTYMVLRISKLTYTLEEIFGIEEKQNKKYIAIEKTISLGELTFLSGIAFAFLKTKIIAGFLILTGFLIMIVPLGYLWFLETLSDFKKQKDKNNKEELKNV